MSEGTGGADLRYERDRFVAFAFATADAFVELDADGIIQYATGAVQWLAGAGAADLKGKPLRDLVAASDRPLLSAALDAGKRQGRFGPVSLTLPRGKKKLRVVAFGTYLPVRGGRTFLSLSAQRMMDTSKPQDPAAVDQETGLLKKDAFADIGQRAMRAGEEAGRDYNMTLIDLEGMADLKSRLEGDQADAIVAEISAQLQASSVGGQSAGRISDEKYGLVHDADLDISALQASIVNKAMEADPDGKGLNVGTTTVDLDANAMSDSDNAKALLYTINKFSDSHGDFTITELAGGYKEMLDETRTKIATFKSTVADGKFDALFQPIVDLGTRKVHHYEALARLHESGGESSPFKFITFAEETGVIGDFDLAMVKKVAARIKGARERGDSVSIAVNLSGRSIESPAFLDELHVLLKGYGDIREELMFEITESAKISDLESTNNVIHGIRELGHHVCLDDFGAGASAFQYLRALEVDYVKIDGVYVRESLTTPNGKAFLKSMASLCADLGIQTVGEFVETDAVADFLRQSGVKFGQGYLFGKPGMGLSGQKKVQAAQ